MLDEAPCVLSVGRLTANHGFDLTWRHDKTPYLKDPQTGQRIKLHVETAVPYLYEPSKGNKSQIMAFPFEEGGSSASTGPNPDATKSKFGKGSMFSRWMDPPDVSAVEVIDGIETAVHDEASGQMMAPMSIHDKADEREETPERIGVSRKDISLSLDHLMTHRV